MLPPAPRQPSHHGRHVTSQQIGQLLRMNRRARYGAGRHRHRDGIGDLGAIPGFVVPQLADGGVVLLLYTAQLQNKV